jgi:4-amino-4-deoxychorismate lyase
MNRSMKTLCGQEDYFNLESFLKRLDKPSTGLYKCRITYDEHSKEVEFLPYQFKVIRNLRVVEHDRINYEFKYADRKTIDKLFELRKDCDDIIIVKQGFVTDSSFSNIVFKSGKRWITPWSALLKGTQRQKLLTENKIKEEDVRVEDIRSFQCCKLINALMEFDAPEIDVSNIVF